MTEKSPASSIHSTEPVMASFDGGDAVAAANNVADEQSGQPDSSARDDHSDGGVPAAVSSSTESSQLPVVSMSDEAAVEVDKVDKLKLSTLKELTVVSCTEVYLKLRAVQLTCYHVNY